MALQSSGQISTSDINAELGRSGTAEYKFASAAGGTYGAINTASASKPDNIEPHYISEWYGYNHSATISNDYYWDTGGNRVFYTSGSNFPTSVTTGFSISIWVAPRWTTATNNNVFLDIRPDTTTSTNNRWFIQYHYNNNRLVFNRRANGSNHQQQWSIHDHSSATGISSSSTKWNASNGNKNSNGFTHLLFTYDGSQSGSNNTMKVYWNGNAMGTTLFSHANSVFAHPTMDEMSLNGNRHNTNGSKDTDYDMIQLYDVALSSSDAVTLYNSGVPITASDASLSTNLIFEDRAESATGVDESGNWSFSSNNGARVTAY